MDRSGPGAHDVAGQDRIGDEPRVRAQSACNHQSAVRQRSAGQRSASPWRRLVGGGAVRRGDSTRRAVKAREQASSESDRR